MVCITLQRSKSRHECCFRFKNKLRSRLISRRTRGLAPQRRGWNLEVADEDGDDFEVRSGTGRCRRTAVSAAGPGHVPLPAGMSERSRRRHDCREIATGRCWTKRRARAGRAGADPRRPHGGDRKSSSACRLPARGGGRCPCAHLGETPRAAPRDLVSACGGRHMPRGARSARRCVRRRSGCGGTGGCAPRFPPGSLLGPLRLESLSWYSPT
jgi:hypothetical protein